MESEEEKPLDDPKLQALAAKVAGRHERFLARGGQAPRTLAAPPVGDIPGSLKAAMMECQKPFQLWNVTRVAEVAEPRFEPVEPYKVGAAAKDAVTREGQPGKVVPASRLLKGAREEVDLVRADAFGAKRRLKRMLTESAEEQGLGVPDEQ